MVNCSAIGCTNRSANFKDGEVSFHKLPKDKTLRDKWIHSIRRDGELPKDSSIVICSQHFEENCYERDLKAELMGTKSKRILTKDALPTKFSFATSTKRIRESSINRTERKEKKQCVKDIFEEINMSAISCFESEPGLSSTFIEEQTDDMSNYKVDTADKFVSTAVKMKSVRSQTDQTLSNNVKKREILQVKEKAPKKTKDAICNTDISFSPSENVTFTSSNTLSSVLSGDEEQIDSEKRVYDPDYEFSSDTDNENILTQDDNLFSFDSPVTEPKFFIFWSSLITLFKHCFTCFLPAIIISTRTQGSSLFIKTKCSEGHIFDWQSQPSSQGNLLLSAAILYSGNTYTRISELLKMINVIHMPSVSFYQTQRKFLFPVLNSFYKISQESVEECKLINNNFIGDGRSDSPGYSAKYGTYSLMSTEIGKVVDFYVVQVTSAGNSNRMEKMGLEILLAKHKNLNMKTLSTDRHIQIRAFMKKEHPQILHQFDVWHFGKSIKKSLSNLSKKKRYEELGKLIKSIINHLWWCCASSKGDSELLREKWLSIMSHICGDHQWEGNAKFHACEHGPLDKEREWLTKGSATYLALKEIIENKRTIDDLSYLSEFCHTGSLEVYHSLINKYCPKRLHFSLYGMIARTQLAVLDFNHGASQQQAKTKDGKQRYKQSFSRVTQNWVVKIIKEKKSYDYLEHLLKMTLEATSEHVLPTIPEIPKTIEPIEKPDKDEAIKSEK